MPALEASGAPALYATEGESDPVVWAVYHHPGLGWYWYLLEYDPSEDLAFGLVQGFCEELGYFRLSELAENGCTRLERPPMPLSEVRALPKAA